MRTGYTSRIYRRKRHCARPPAFLCNCGYLVVSMNTNLMAHRLNLFIATTLFSACSHGHSHVIFSMQPWSQSRYFQLAALVTVTLFFSMQSWSQSRYFQLAALVTVTLFFQHAVLVTVTTLFFSMQSWSQLQRCSQHAFLVTVTTLFSACILGHSHNAVLNMHSLVTVTTLFSACSCPNRSWKSMT